MNNSISIHRAHEIYSLSRTYPSVGPQTAAMPQMATEYARFLGAQISASDAPPVARTGEPKNPVMNRKARSIPKFEARAAAGCKPTKTTSVPR